MFINYCTTHGLSINTYRLPHAEAGDIAELAAMLETEQNAVSCPLDGAVAALDNPQIWAHRRVSPSTIAQLREWIISEAGD